MKEIRFLGTMEASGAMQMAIDESIMMARAEGNVPDTLRFYTWKPKCVTIGFFQGLDKEVDTEKAKAESIDVVRRYTGGGAVFHDSELTYSLVISEDEVPSDIIESYRAICQGVIDALKALGIKAEFAPINDIIVGGKKISGNAQTRKSGVVLQHGTLLLDMDVDRMFSLLKVPDEKVKDKLIQTVKDRVTSVKQQLGKDIPLEEVEDAMGRGFSSALGRNPVPGHLTDQEKQTAEKLIKEKYSARKWTETR